MERLAESASGLRHLRWAREVLATLEMHHEHDGRLTADERDRVLDECVELRAVVNALSAAHGLQEIVRAGRGHQACSRAPFAAQAAAQAR